MQRDREPAGRALGTALALALATLTLALGLAGDYGPTWDAVRTELPWGEASLGRLLGKGEDVLELRDDPGLGVRSPHYDLEQGRLPWFAAWPLASTLGAASCQVLWTELGLVSPVRAHGLVLAVIVALLAGVATYAAARRFGPLTGFGTGAFLVLSPRFFADSFNNWKDVPETFLYTLAALALFVALTRGGLRWWIAGGVLTGLALVQRPNALFLPIQMAGVWIGASAWRRLRTEQPALPRPWLGALVALALVPLVVLAASPVLWNDTLARLLAQMHFYFRSTDLGDQGFLGLGPIRKAGLVNFLCSTPPAIGLLAVVGLFDARLRAEERLLLALGVAVPVGRTLLPGMVDYDGVRHFLEFHPPLAALAGIGLSRVALALARLGAGLLAPTVVVGVLVGSVASQTVRTHPNGTCYANALAARLPWRGFHVDYWANSHWQALSWLSRSAEPGAGLIVPVAEHVARSGAPLRLRSDVAFVEPAAPPPEVIYVVWLLKPDKESAGLARRLAASAPCHEIRVQGEAISRIYRFDGAEARELHALWAREQTSQAATRRVFRWVKRDPALLRRCLEAERAGGMAAVLALLDGVAPDDLRHDLDLLEAWWSDPENPLSRWMHVPRRRQRQVAR